MADLIQSIESARELLLTRRERTQRPASLDSDTDAILLFLRKLIVFVSASDLAAPVPKSYGGHK